MDSARRLVGGALILVTFVAAGSSAKDAAALPLPEELPANTVVIVSHLPQGLGTITRREFQHALVLSAANSGWDSVPRRGEERYEEIWDEALGERIEAVWISGQAKEMGIVTTRREIVRSLLEIKEGSFESGAEWRRFLRETRLTRRDVNERIELQIFSEKIQERVSAGIRSAAGKRKAFEQFVAAYQERWGSRTVCAPDYVIEPCSNAS